MSYKIKIIEAPRTYEGINALYLSCPAESHNCNFNGVPLYSIVFEVKSTPIVAYKNQNLEKKNLLLRIHLKIYCL